MLIIYRAGSAHACITGHWPAATRPALALLCDVILPRGMQALHDFPIAGVLAVLHLAELAPVSSLFKFESDRAKSTSCLLCELEVEKPNTFCIRRFLA